MTAMTTRANLMVTDITWMQYWTRHPKILFQRTFEDGGKNLFDSGGKPGEFELAARVDGDGRLIGYTVVANGTKLPRGWHGVSMAPMGTHPPGTIGDLLPPYLDTDLDCKKKYEAALRYLVADLHSEKTDYQRLEGLFPVFDDVTGTFNIDRVRLVNVPAMVEVRPGQTQDLSLVVLTLISGTSVKQNGGGNGPPEP